MAPKPQLTALIDALPPLSPPDKTLLQESIGVLLYYACTTDPTLLVALGTLTTAQTKGTQATMDACIQLLNYCATHPDATICYIASDMHLHTHSDASYLSEPEARSRVGGIHFLSSAPKDPNKAPHPDDPPPPLNGAVHIVSNIMCQVLASAAEAEMGGLFYNGQEAVVTIRTTLIDTGYPQPPIPLQPDNSTAAGISNSTVKQRRSKAIDMRFYWIRDGVNQGQFLVHWKRGATNQADYFTKHRPTAHHRLKRSTYLHDPSA
jgi:hypothetical protein